MTGSKSAIWGYLWDQVFLPATSWVVVPTTHGSSSATFVAYLLGISPESANKDRKVAVAMRPGPKNGDLCERCGSSYKADFGTEVCIHASGIENLTFPHAFVFPKLAVCLECGCASGFMIPEEDLLKLRECVKKGSDSRYDTARD